MLNSPVDIAIIAGVVLLIFGPKKVPEFGRALGQGIGNFKKALTEAQEEVSSAIKAAEEKPSTAPIDPKDQKDQPEEAQKVPGTPTTVQKDDNGVYRTEATAAPKEKETTSGSA